MHKYIIYLWSITATTLLYSGVYAAKEIPQLECAYADKFQQCAVANQNGSARSIDEFVCLQSNNYENILDQIILDVKFKEIDEEVEKFIEWLEKDKEKALTDTNRVIDDISKNLLPEWVFYKKYKDLCNWGILVERATCTGNIPLVPVGNRVRWSNLSSTCMTMVESNLDIASSVAFNITGLNKQKVMEDQYKKDIVQKQRDKYSELTSPLMTDIIGHMWRLARGVTHWTPNPLQAGVMRILWNKISNLV